MKTTPEQRFWAKAEAAVIAKRCELFTHNDVDRRAVS
jgi:hypothetical protein